MRYIWTTLWLCGMTSLCRIARPEDNPRLIISTPLKSHYCLEASGRGSLRLILGTATVFVWRQSQLSDSELPAEWTFMSLNGDILDSSKATTIGPDEASPGIREALLAVKWRTVLTNTVSHAIDPAGSVCLRAFSCGTYVPPNPPTARIDLYDLKKQRTLWSKDIPTFQDAKKLILIPGATQTIALVLFGGMKGVLLDAGTGNFVTEFSYGPVESRDEVKSRKERFRLDLPEDDPALRFSGTSFAVEPRNRLLAVGCMNDRRVRVLTLDPPYRLLLELHSDEHPRRPEGGSWRVDRVDFAANGRFLIVESYFAGRGTRKVLRPTEIYETEGWKKVWETNDATIQAVTLSPDGTKIAYIQKDTLKIALFKPRN